MSEVAHALYRKHRPQKFADVQNQDHIVSVLKGAIEKQNIPHALLFTGTRGTGKTTVARIFAHEIGADDVDIYEIDAASNRGIDDIRALRDAVHTLPYKSPYKVYIIDEVHMLSKDAFNALLKTLEEPPAHVIFILATTEKDKVIDTVISRCQVFTFRTPTRAELRKHVLGIAKKEKCALDEPVADIIALAADGSYRDALGITQKIMLSSGDKKLSADEVNEIVGAPNSALITDLMDAFATRDAEKGLTVLSTVADTHVDIKLFYRLLLERMRNVLLLRNNKSHADTLATQYAEDEIAHITELAHDNEKAINSHLLTKALEIGLHIGKSSIPTLPLELLLIEHCTKA